MNLATAIAISSAFVGIDTSSDLELDDTYTVTNDGGLYAPQRSIPNGKVRDTQRKPKARRKDKRSPRHTQRRR
jgi:hypothetical protein